MHTMQSFSVLTKRHVSCCGNSHDIDDDGDADSDDDDDDDANAAAHVVQVLYEHCPAKKKIVLLNNVGHQEMDLLYALVQTLPEMHSVPLSPHPILIEDLEVRRARFPSPRPSVSSVFLSLNLCPSLSLPLPLPLSLFLSV
jgi:hypothetical protein